MTRTVGDRRVVGVVRSSADTASKAARTFSVRDTPQGTFVFPATATPYLGRILDPGLFDVRRAAPAAGRVGLRVSFSGAEPKVPGLTVTSRAAGALSGYLTPGRAGSGRAFGEALAAQWRADARAGFPARTSLFGATRITLDRPGAPGGSRPGTVSPQFPMRTLVVNSVDAQRRPSKAAFVDVIAVDDMRRKAGFTIAVDGQARLSVPVGTYLVVVTSFDDGDPVTGELRSGREQLLVGVRVTEQDRSGKVVVADARKASSRLQVRTPRQSRTLSTTFMWGHTDAAHTDMASGGISAAGDTPVYVAAAAPARVGTLSSVADFMTADPTTAAAALAPQTTGPGGRRPDAGARAYRYDAAFGPVRGVLSEQAYVVRSRDVSTVRADYRADQVPGVDALCRIVVNPGPVLGSCDSATVPVPSRQVEYVRAATGGYRLDVLFTDATADQDPGIVWDAPWPVKAGRTYPVTWRKGPFLPQVPTLTDPIVAADRANCEACRTPDTLRLALNAAEDTTPGHQVTVRGRPDGVPVARMRVMVDGTTVFDETDTGVAELPVPTAEVGYRVVFDVDRVPSSARLSTSSRTELTFRSAAPDRNSLPAGWTCTPAPADPKPACAVLPLLRADVQLPVDTVGAVPRGRCRVRLTLSHIQGVRPTGRPAGPAAPEITTGTVEVRYPGGAWLRLPVHREHGGTFTASLNTQATHPGDVVDLRVHGTDAAGTAITQTITAAFTVAGR